MRQARAAAAASRNLEHRAMTYRARVPSTPRRNPKRNTPCPAQPDSTAIPRRAQTSKSSPLIMTATRVPPPTSSPQPQPNQPNPPPFGYHPAEECLPPRYSAFQGPSALEHPPWGRPAVEPPPARPRRLFHMGILHMSEMREHAPQPRLRNARKAKGGSDGEDVRSVKTP